VFTVTVDQRGCRVAVTEGQVEVATHDRQSTRLVDPGMEATAPMGNHHAITLAPVGPSEGSRDDSAPEDPTPGSHSHEG
jgi:ferric-dicitrate binding protein FerR (iron transport regulator)